MVGHLLRAMVDQLDCQYFDLHCVRVYGNLFLLDQANWDHAYSVLKGGISMDFMPKFTFKPSHNLVNLTVRFLVSPW